MDLSEFIARNACFTPEKRAIGGVSYAGLAERIDATAKALKAGLGIGRGDRVAVLALNHPDTLVLLYACARLGAMLVPLNWRLAPPEQTWILEHCQAKVLFLQGGLAAGAPPAGCSVVGLDHQPENGLSLEALLVSATGDGRSPHTDLSTPLLVVYTSGTTGRPKGAVLRQEALFWNAVNSQHMHNLTSNDHVLTVLPLFHVGGLNIQTTPALHHGATVTLHPRFSPEATLAAVGHLRPSLTVLVPAAMQAMIAHPDWATTDLSSLRAVTTGSTIVPESLVEAFEARGVPVLQVYGATETCPIAVYTRLGGARPKGATGLPGLVTEARIVTEAGADAPAGTPGEILVRGPTVFFEYWADEAATSEALRDGWYHTGDIARADAGGMFTIVDRKRNVVISGGENVYPAEVERVLHDHPAVAEAAVVGRADARWQEVPVAFVVLHPDASATAEDLAAYTQIHLARFKTPREFIFVDALPRNVMGKVQHFRLRERLRTEEGEGT